MLSEGSKVNHVGDPAIAESPTNTTKLSLGSSRALVFTHKPNDLVSFLLTLIQFVQHLSTIIYCYYLIFIF